MADRVERLTNLLALLLETTQPLSLVEIAGELEGQYPEGLTARRGAFERDKNALRDIGVPIETEVVAGGEYAGQTRYWIDRQRYELEDLELDDDERRALQVALAATRPGSATAQDALWKLGAGMAASELAVSAVVPDHPHLALLRDSIAARHSVSFGYSGADRVVDPWALLLREGFWYLIGYDHVRGARRTYRLDRIEGVVISDPDSTFDRPAGFRAEDVFPADPKLIGVDDTAPDATVRIDPSRAALAVRELGEERVAERGDDGSVVVSVPAGNRPAFRAWLFGFDDHAELLGPADVRADVVDYLRRCSS